MIVIKNVTKTYTMGSMKLTVLKKISLDIEKGEYVSIIGPSGSGKSTLMNILGCLDIPTEGSYYLDNKEISDYTEDQLSEIRNEKIGFIFQKFNLLPKLSALENVELPLIYRGMPAIERKTRAEKLLSDVGLGDRLDHKPTELSGGQQQRVAIARALAGDPPILLADEPTGNLDSKSGDEVVKIIDEMHQKGKTIILITHDNEMAQLANRIVSIKDGIISEEGLNK